MPPETGLTLPPTLTSPLLSPYQLGASLYMPATRQDIWQVILREKLPTLNSVIICLEDAVSAQDLPQALANLQQLLQHWAKNEVNPTLQPPFLSSHCPKTTRPLVFIRPRTPQLLSELAQWQHSHLVDGFVLPKVDMHTLPAWRVACQDLPKDTWLMPTLETVAIFNPIHNHELAGALIEVFGNSVLALRIGGNDLLASLRLRRAKFTGLYDTPLGAVVYQLIGCFVPYGFYLTAPVFEYLDTPAVFSQELNQDVAVGLVGKTIIHPSQILPVQQAWAVTQAEYNQAGAILHKDAKAVFKYDNAMLEPMTHASWAQQIIQRERVFGIRLSD